MNLVTATELEALFLSACQKEKMPCDLSGCVVVGIDNPKDPGLWTVLSPRNRALANPAVQEVIFDFRRSYRLRD